MFNRLRKQTPAEPFYEAATELDEPTVPIQTTAGFLRMTPRQRLIIALLLMVAVCVLSTMCLLVTGRIAILQ